MALQIRRGLQNELDAITPLEGEPIWVTDQEKLVIGDGITQGGINVTQNLQDLRITSAGTKTSLYDADTSGTIALINGTNSFELAVNSTGTHITGPLNVSTTASVTTLRFSDGSIQTTADTANYDQNLNTTSSVRFAALTVTNIATFGASAISMDIGSSRRVDIGNTSMELGGGAVDFTINPGNSTARTLTIGQNSNAGFMVVEPSQVRIGVSNTDVATLNTNTTNIQSYSNIFGRGTVGQNVFIGTKGSTILEIKADQDGSGGGTSARLQVRPDQSIIFYDTAYNQIVSFSTASINVNQKIQPVGDNTTDLGSSSNQWRNLYVGGEIIANKLTIQYTTVTTTLVETDDIIKTTNATSAGAGVGAIVATAGGISATNGYFSDTTNATNSTTGALRVVGGVNVGNDLWVQGGDIRGPSIKIEEQTSAFVKKSISINTSQIDVQGTMKVNGPLENSGSISANSTLTNLSLYGGSFTAGVPAGVGAKITLKRALDNGDIVFSPNQTDVMTLTNTSLNISVPVVINNTATTSTLYNAQISFDTTNPPVPGFASLSSYPGATKFASTLSGAGITIETFRTSTGFQRWHFSRSGSLVFPGGSSYFSSSSGSSLTGPSNAPVSLSDGNVQSLIELTTSTGMKLWTDWQTAAVPTIDVQTSAVSLNAPLAATTATITYTNIATEGQLRSQSTSWPFGENTATIMTIDTTVYGSARLNILVGATFGLDSHTERLTMDILTNGVDVLNAQSGVLATTSTGLCSYTAELSGTNIVVKAVAIDPVNFLDYNAKTIAELVAKPTGGL